MIAHFLAILCPKVPKLYTIVYDVRMINAFALVIKNG